MVGDVPEDRVPERWREPVEVGRDVHQPLALDVLQRQVGLDGAAGSVVALDALDESGLDGLVRPLAHEREREEVPEAQEVRDHGRQGDVPHPNAHGGPVAVDRLREHLDLEVVGEGLEERDVLVEEVRVAEPARGGGELGRGGQVTVAEVSDDGLDGIAGTGVLAAGGEREPEEGEEE